MKRIHWNCPNEGIILKNVSGGDAPRPPYLSYASHLVATTSPNLLLLNYLLYPYTLSDYTCVTPPPPIFTLYIYLMQLTFLVDSTGILIWLIFIAISSIFFYYFLASTGSSRKILRDTHATSEHAENMSTTKLRGSVNVEIRRNKGYNWKKSDRQNFSRT